MKIGLVCPYNVFRAGGVQECVKALDGQFTAMGHHVKIIAPQPRQPITVPVPENYILLGRSIDINSLSTTPSISVSADSRQVQDVLDKEAFDILHFHEPWVPVLSRQILQKSAAVNVATVHAKLPESLRAKSLVGAVKPYLKSIMKQFDGFSAVSEAAAEYLINVSPESSVEIIANGVDLEAYKWHPETGRQSQTILYLGRLEKRKGLKHLIRSFSLLAERQPDLRLVIAGEGTSQTKLEALAAELKLTAKVKFLGYIDDGRKQQLLRTSTVLAAPALYGESFGIILLEAMASGLPIVGGNNPGYQTVLTGRGSISLVNPKDHLEFANRLGLMINDQPLREWWRQWAASQLPAYAYPKIAKQYLQLYQRLLKQSAK